MWALDDGSLAFVHIPKNAGTSITEQLNLHPSTMNKNVMADLNKNFSKHATAPNIRKMFSKLHPSPVLFAVVRDPYARAHSMWRQFITSIKFAYESGQSIYIEYDRHVTRTYSDEEFGFKRFLIDKPDWH